MPPSRPGGRRIRTIKPEILSDAKARRLGDRDWRLFVSTFLLADDEGRFEADAHVVGPDVFGYAATEAEVEEAIMRLHANGLVDLWHHDSRRLGQVAGWTKHQKIDHPSKSRLPGPEDEGSLVVPRECQPAIREYSRGPGERSSVPRSGSDQDQDRIRIGSSSRADKPRDLQLAVSSSPEVEVLKPCCKPAKDGNRVQAVTWHFCQLHRERLGMPYAHAYARDGAAVKRLPGEYDSGKLLELLDRFFDNPDKFVFEKRGVSIPAFVDKIPALLASHGNGRLVEDFIADMERFER